MATTDYQPSDGPKVISATMLRTRSWDILEEARFGGGQFIVETFGKPMVAILSVDEYWKLKERAGSTAPVTQDA
jgi:hypothetical protein